MIAVILMILYCLNYLYQYVFYTLPLIIKFMIFMIYFSVFSMNCSFYHFVILLLHVICLNIHTSEIFSHYMLSLFFSISLNSFNSIEKLINNQTLVYCKLFRVMAYELWCEDHLLGWFSYYGLWNLSSYYNSLHQVVVLII